MTRGTCCRPRLALLLIVLAVVWPGGAGRRPPDTDPLSPLEEAIIYLDGHPELLRNVAASIRRPIPASLVQSSGTKPGPQDAICTGCVSLISFVKSLIFVGVKWEEVRDEVVSICKVVVVPKYERGDILCPPLMDNYGPLVYDVLKKAKKPSKQICTHMNWCNPSEMKPRRLKRSEEQSRRASSDLIIFKGLLLKRLEGKITKILQDSGVLDDFKSRGSGSNDKDKKNVKEDTGLKDPPFSTIPRDKLTPSSDQGVENIKKKQVVFDGTSVLDGLKGITSDIEVPKIDEIIEGLHLDKVDIPGRISDLLDIARDPEAWKEKFPIETILQKSEKLEKKLNEVMANVKLKDGLEPNARKMANIIADAITRPTRSRSKRHLSNFSKENTLKVAHLTDIHVEEDYLTGAATDCGLPTCCQPGISGTGAAGQWGAYTCNVPPRTTIQLLKHAASQNPDFAIYSGDNPPHAVWLETLETQLNASRWAAEEISKAFYPTKVFPNMGNHENFPTNMYHPAREETKVLHVEWGDMFKEVAGFTSEQLETIHKSGYYTVLVRPGLRIVAYNSNYAGTGNFYNIINYDRPEFTEMINWLENTLAVARNASERVIITSHHQYGTSRNVVAFDEKITRILAKYGDIIVWHPVGHVHRDEFRLNFDPVTGDPVGVVTIGMTMNTRPHVNPGYRLFYLDPESYKLLGYEQYFFDLEKANEDPDAPYPVVKLYSTAEDYGMDDLTPSSYLALYQRLMSDDGLLQRYWHYRRAGTDADGVCDAECKASQKCHIVSPTFDIYRECMRDQGGQPQNQQHPLGSAASALLKNSESSLQGFGQRSKLVEASGSSAFRENVALFVTSIMASCVIISINKCH